MRKGMEGEVGTWRESITLSHSCFLPIDNRLQFQYVCRLQMQYKAGDEIAFVESISLCRFKI